MIKKRERESLNKMKDGQKRVSNKVMCKIEFSSTLLPHKIKNFMSSEKLSLP